MEPFCGFQDGLMLSFNFVVLLNGLQQTFYKDNAKVCNQSALLRRNFIILAILDDLDGICNLHIQEYRCQ